jgi:hypothetical protein
VNFFVKILLDKIVKPEIDSLKADLQTNRDAHIAQLEADVAAGGTTAAAAVESFIVGKAKANPTVSLVESAFAPEINGFLAGLVANGSASVPELYDKVVAFVIKEDSEV